MENFTVIDHILKSPYPIFAFAMVILLFAIRAIKANWPGFVKFINMVVDRYFNDKEQQLEIQIELEIQIKNLLAAHTALQEHLKEMLTQDRDIENLIKELKLNQEHLNEAFWDVRRTQDAYFRKTDTIWTQIGVTFPQEKETHDQSKAH